MVQEYSICWQNAVSVQGTRQPILVRERPMINIFRRAHARLHRSAAGRGDSCYWVAALSASVSVSIIGACSVNRPRQEWPRWKGAS